MSVRVRFAPSPSGFLHVGGARTALFNWLFARRHQGAFILRIEDTDRDRSSEESVSVILDGLRWLGLDWDEGPVFQSAGIDRHRKDAMSLLESGAAYRDFAPPEEVARLRGQDPALAIRHVREVAERLAPGEAEARAAAGEPHAIRFRVQPGETSWEDAVHGPLSFQNEDIEDLVLLRADGTPTYNLAVASDDADMKITHVIRGDDHISNTPKQILILRALGQKLPVFAHAPMILGEDGKRLSKRHGATAVGEYEPMGILPDAMVNFLSLLGWSPGNDEEVMTREEIVGKFSLDRVLKKSAIFDRAKLDWLNRQHMARLPAEQMVGRLLEELGPRRAPAERRLAEDRAWFLRLLDLLRPRARTLEELAAQMATYLDDSVEYDPAAVAAHWGEDPAGVAELLRALRDRLEATAWEASALEAAVRDMAKERECAAGKLIHPLRVALTGTGASPGIFDVLMLLGRDGTVRRVDAALNQLARGRPDA